MVSETPALVGLIEVCGGRQESTHNSCWTMGGPHHRHGDVAASSHLVEGRSRSGDSCVQFHLDRVTPMSCSFPPCPRLPQQCAECVAPPVAQQNCWNITCDWAPTCDVCVSRHCVELFLDFVAIFRKLMVILAMNDKVFPPTSHSIHSVGVSLDNNNHLVLFIFPRKRRRKRSRCAGCQTRPWCFFTSCLHLLTLCFIIEL